MGITEDDRLRAWQESAMSDAERRGLPGLKPLLESLGRAVAALRSADWNDDASGGPQAAPPRSAETA